MIPTLEQIKGAVLEVLGVPEEEYEAMKKRRLPMPVRVRQMISLFGRENDYSLKKIARFLELDHTTVHHNAIKAKDFCETEKEYGMQVRAIRAKLRDMEKQCDDTCDRCLDCEVFKNFEEREKAFAFGFFCPIKNEYVEREDAACKWMVSDKMPF